MSNSIESEEENEIKIITKTIEEINEAHQQDDKNEWKLEVVVFY